MEEVTEHSLGERREGEQGGDGVGEGAGWEGGGGGGKGRRRSEVKGRTLVSGADTE